jgi:hypothetical protein
LVVSRPSCAMLLEAKELRRTNKDGLLTLEEPLVAVLEGAAVVALDDVCRVVDGDIVSTELGTLLEDIKLVVAAATVVVGGAGRADRFHEENLGFASLENDVPVG